MMSILNKTCGVLAAGVGIVAIGMNGGGVTQTPPDNSEDTPLMGSPYFPSTKGNGSAPAATTGTPPPYTGGNGNFDSAAALAYSETDSATGGYCARGVANITAAQGLGDFSGMDASSFEGRMASQGWTKLDGYSPSNAPVGSMLLYNSDTNLGKDARNGGGGLYGHVELVGNTSTGGRTYISDKARDNFGGTVPDNFTGVWVKK